MVRQRDPDILLRRLLDALATQTTLDPDTIERLLEEFRDPSRRKTLAAGLRAAGLASPSFAPGGSASPKPTGWRPSRLSPTVKA